MKIINIPYNNWSIGKFRYRVKTATTRSKRYGEIGDIHSVVGLSLWLETIYQARVTLGFVARYFWRHEGAISEEDFIKVWVEIHPKKGFDPNQKVWLHLFREIDMRKRIMIKKEIKEKSRTGAQKRLVLTPKVRRDITIANNNKPQETA